MRRYALEVGSISAGARLGVWLVIATDEVPESDVFALGFISVDAHLSDAEVRQRYGVAQIHLVHDDRMDRAGVN